MAGEKSVSWIKAGLLCRCPRCGEGKLFKGYIRITEGCSVCELDLSSVDSADGPASIVMLVVGFLVVAGALIVETLFQPSYWVHAAIWFPLTIVLALGLLRPFKAMFIAIEYKHKAAEERFTP